MVREASIFLEPFPKITWISLVLKMVKGQSEREGGTNSSGSIFEDEWPLHSSSEDRRT